VRYWRAIRSMSTTGGAAAALALMLQAFSSAQTLTPAEALSDYLADSRDHHPGCSDAVFTVQLDASLPALRKQGSMSGLKAISKTGQIVYRGLRFTGDNLVKTSVIARFLARDTNPPERDGDAGVTPQNYFITYDKTADYNGLTAYVFLLRPRRKRAELILGELWLTADTAEPLRLWGDMVKSPSIFIRSFRLVQDYQMIAGCSQPLRLLLTIGTRIAGTVEMVEWLHPAADEPQVTEVSESSSEFQEVERQNEDRD
jgi:hypothetical protein